MSKPACVLLAVMATVSSVGAETTAETANIEALLSLAGKGDESAQHALCFRFLYGEGVEPSYPNAVHWCQIAAKTGDPNSQTLLAEIHYKGHGVPIDYEQSFSLYQAAAEKGHMHAQYMLGRMYLLGQGRQQDAELGMTWLKRAADQGYSVAIETLQKLESLRRTDA